MLLIIILMIALLLLLPRTAFAKGGGKGGGKSAPKISAPPAAPEPEPLPDTTAQEPESAAVRDAEAKKARRRKGAAGTVLTSPLGDSTLTSSGSPTLLGRMG
jgi:hypothetical protein